MQIETFHQTGMMNSVCKKVMESRCRDVLELTFPGYKFPTVRPSWLKNPNTKMNLELDCYNHDLVLALEYQGQQHYKFPNIWHTTEFQFAKTVEHDRWKAKVCAKLGVCLITVPYTIRKQDLKQFITKAIPKSKFDLYQRQQTTKMVRPQQQQHRTNKKLSSS
jgi:hypothetical protein